MHFIKTIKSDQTCMNASAQHSSIDINSLCVYIDIHLIFNMITFGLVCARARVCECVSVKATEQQKLRLTLRNAFSNKLPDLIYHPVCN